MALDTRAKLYIHELKDIYSAEKQLIKALPKVIKNINAADVQKVLSKHLEQTKHHAERIEKIMKGHGFAATGVKCKGMEGLVAEADDIIKEKELPKDLLAECLLSGSKKIENYEIVAYESAIKLAVELGHHSDAQHLEHSLVEEQQALQNLREHSY
jgi:ferritin-like metal-binding protein YciE